MFDPQQIGMEGLSSKTRQGPAGFQGETGALGSKAGPIGVIAQQWMADRGQMDANLVRAPGHQPAGQQACDRSPIGASIALQDLPMSYGFAALRMHGHFVAGVRMTADRGLDGALGPLQHPPYEG